MNTYNSHSVDIDIGSPEHMSQCDISLPHAWYPVAKSRAIKRGQKQTLHFMEREWLLFRTQQGQVGTVARHCSHMGGDLNQGQVDRDCIRCPVHGWRFDHQGQCQSQLKHPFKQQAQLASLDTAEYAGVIYVFTLPQAMYPLPHLPFDQRCHFSRVRKLKLPVHFLLASMNSFDVAHYDYVHHRKITEKPDIYSHDKHHLGIELKAQVLQKSWHDKLMSWLGFDQVDIRIDCWGSSYLQMFNHQAQMGAIISVMPIDHQNSEIYLTAYDCKTSDKGLFRPFKSIKLELSRRITTAFLMSDVPIARGLRPVEGVLIPGQDDEVKQFWSYYKKLPKTTIYHEN